MNFRPPPVSRFQFDLDPSGNNGGLAWDDGFQSQDYLKNLLKSQYPGAVNSGYFTSGWAQPRFEQSTQEAYDALTPGGARARVDQFGRGEMERAASGGRQTAGFLRNLGYSRSAQDGARLDAVNQGRTRTSDYAAETTDPFRLAMQRQELAKSASYGPGVQNILQLLGMGKDSPGSPTFLQQALGIAGKLFSDRRLKSNVKRVGTHRLGIGLYEYDIFGERTTGVMADEVKNVLPEAVSRHASGYEVVDYSMIGGL